jgi:hypothetical protein
MMAGMGGGAEDLDCFAPRVNPPQRSPHPSAAALTISDELIDEALDILSDCLAELTR